MKQFITFMVAFLFFSFLPIYANTVMITYDITMSEGQTKSLYAERTSAELESFIMGELFDRGHIVFNYPGEIYFTQKPEERKFRNELLKRSMAAADGGASLFIYLNLYFEGTREDNIHLSSLDYEIINIGKAVLDHANIQYTLPPRIAPDDASRIFFDRIDGKDIF